MSQPEDNLPDLEAADPIHPVYVMGQAGVAERKHPRHGPTFVRFEDQEDRWFYIDSSQDLPQDGVFLSLKQRLLEAWRENALVQQAFDSAMSRARQDGREIRHIADLNEQEYTEALELALAFLVDGYENLEEHVEQMHLVNPQPLEY